MITAHTVSSYERELKHLEDLIHGMGLYGISQLERALAALEVRDAALSASVIAGDVREDTLASEVDRLVVQLIALRQPAASDLRHVVSAFKSAVHLERIGDYATNICELIYYRISGEHLPARKPRRDAVAQEKAPAGFPEGASIQEPGSDLLSH